MKTSPSTVNGGLTLTFRWLTATVLAAAISGPASASFVHSSQNVDFTFNVLDSDTFTLRMQKALDATGNWASATSLDAIGFKDLGINFQASGVSASLTANPSSSSWAYVQAELDAGGCKDPSGQKGVICFDATPSLALTNDILFTVNVVNAVLNIDQTKGPHLKLQFLDATGKKAGDLLSVNMKYKDDDGNPPADTPVPAPAPLALIGLGAALLGLTRRRLPTNNPRVLRAA